MNKINPKKLLHSKWTAMVPTNQEKHFEVSEITFDEGGMVVSCWIEAVMSKNSVSINWHDLKDQNHWVHGWK